MVFSFFFQTPAKQVVLQTENSSELPATQKPMNKQLQYDILLKKGGSAPSTGNKCHKISINVLP